MSKKNKTIPPPPFLPCTGVESHAHLDSLEYNEDLTAVIERATKAGVAQIIQVFLHPDVYKAQKERFAPFTHIYYILGIHPTEADEYNTLVHEKMRQCIHDEPRFKAIGEIGLDYYWKDQPQALQQEVFIQQLHLAKECALPVVIHSRDAHDDVLRILLEQDFSGYPLLWHCFGSDIAFAQTILQHGWHISVPGVITFPANKELREAIKHIPVNKLLTETDCPYLSPVPLRGKRNEPAYLAYTIEAMAKAKEMDVAELWTACGNNARRFFGIKE